MSTYASYIKVMPGILTRKQFDAWRGFRFMVEQTSLGVSRQLFSSTGMSGGQFGILTILVETPHHVMRQQELADRMRWDRTRLSHQLTRMETQGWIKREKGDKGATLVSLAEAGSREQHRAAPVLSQIVRERFFSRLTRAQLTALEQIRAALTIE